MGVLFHLTEINQQNVIAKVSNALKIGGQFLFTAQKDTINGNSEMNGFSFPYISLGYERYAAILQANGMKLTKAFFDEGDNYVYISEKIN